jgi:hypothetical protein
VAEYLGQHLRDRYDGSTPRSRTGVRCRRGNRKPNAQGTAHHGTRAMARS